MRGPPVPQDSKADETDVTVTTAQMKQAAAWYARLDGGVPGDRERVAFEGWLAADPAHRAAWDRIGDAWDAFDTIPEDARPLADLPSRRPRGAGKSMFVAAAAAAAVAILVAFGTGAPERLRIEVMADMTTDVGETKTVELADGSRIELNTASAVAVDFVPGGPRRVRLLDGEALFEVVHDPDRPFIVLAAGSESRVLGTVFDVRTNGEEAAVTLVTGRLAVSAGGGDTILAPGQRVSFAAGRLGPVADADPAAIAAWRRGKLVFQDRPLGEVVDELNRYHPGVLRVVGADLAARRVNGVFDLGDPVAVVGALETALDITSFRLTNFLIVLHD